MGRTLCAYVYVDGRRWGPGDQPPPGVAEKIRNPKVWSGEPETPDAGGDTVSGSAAPVDPPAAPMAAGSGTAAAAPVPDPAPADPDPDSDSGPDAEPADRPARGRRRRQAA